MHLFLTDRLACPRCGPEFGLILLAERVMERRILEGELGCANCRERYPVKGGFADLRPPPRAALAPVSDSPEPALPGSEGSLEGAPPASQDTATAALPDSEETPGAALNASDETLRLAALLGVTQGPGTLLVKGPSARFAKGLAELIGQVEIVAMDWRLGNDEESPSVSRMVSGTRMPFFNGSFLGVLFDGSAEEEDLAEAARVVAPRGRVVVLGAPQGLRSIMEKLGLSVLSDDEGVLVGRRIGDESPPLVTLRGP